MAFNLNDIVNIIKTDITAAIGSDVGNRIYCLTAKQDSSLPVCVFTTVGNTHTIGLGCDSSEFRVQIQLFGYRQSGTEALRVINDKLVNALHRKEIVDTTYVNCLYKNLQWGVETLTDDIVEIRSEFIVFISEL
jgi:hypothetical protein